MSGTNYFSYFPQVEHTLPTGTKVVTDIFKRVKLRSLSMVVKSSIFYKYTIRENESPEDLANRYYGDTQYYWLILYANEIINVYAQWPRNNRDFENYIVAKYGSVESVAAVIDTENFDELKVHHYEDEKGNWISKEMWLLSTDPYKLTRVITTYEWEYRLNEDKREINVIKKNYVQQIISEMNRLF